MAKLTFYGAAGTVTGSKYLLESEGRKILIDCGMFQGLKELRDLNWQEPPFEASEIDACIITHAHIDHIGYLPRIVKNGFNKPVYCSRGTSDLMKLSLPDAARLQEEDADYRNRHHKTSHEPALPLYTEEDAREALGLLKQVSNDGASVEVTDGIRASFRVAGHILGASHVLVEVTEANGKTIKILFSGDIGRPNQPIIREPETPPACDYLIVESTYGDRLHDKTDVKEELARMINDAARRKGALLIPTFAIGRTQEVVYLIRELETENRIPVLPVRVDSPMAAQATAIYNHRSEEHDEEYKQVLRGKIHPLRTRAMLSVSSREESKKLNAERGARIIISASGMMTGGRVLHHAMRILPDERATVCFVGYQAVGTTGRRILDGEREVKIMKEWIPVRAHVERISGMSAHGDYAEILSWLEGITTTPRRVFTTHGEPVALAAMGAHINERFGWTTHAPAYGESVELD
ncbi:MAG: MBL fold metallo-hydrolase [Pyrinomonadaceae bacterium MAG19_C2-C3]|nr:MBL fold metallo-hydrolase [Pyrinomonadaceae bacterium MAG19_C2-C3]